MIWWKLWPTTSRKLTHFTTSSHSSPLTSVITTLCSLFILASSHLQITSTPLSHFNLQSRLSSNSTVQVLDNSSIVRQYCTPLSAFKHAVFVLYYRKLRQSSSHEHANYPLIPTPPSFLDDAH
ncbi:hypothetical protein JCM5353_000126 [Sporobolomyces roseus]